MEGMEGLMVSLLPRRFLHRPWLALTVVLTIGLGIALNVAMFTIVNAVLLKPLPFPASDRLIVLGSARAEEPGQLRPMSLNDLADLRKARSLGAAGAWRDWSFRMRTPAGPRSVLASIVTPGFFEALPVTPLLGRLFGADEDRPGQNMRVLISESLWRDEFGADRGILGHSITLSRAPMGETAFTIIGVVPDDIGWPPVEDTQMWALSSIDADAGLRRDLRNRRVVARMRPGISVSEANVELAVLAQGLETTYPATN